MKVSLRRAAQTAALLCALAALILLAGEASDVLRISDRVDTEDTAGLFTAVFPTQVQVFAGRVRGAGTVISYDKDAVYILTCRHLAEKADEDTGTYAVFCTGTAADAYVVFLSQRADIAVLSCPKEALPKKELQMIRVAAIDPAAYDRAYAYDRVIALHAKVTGTDDNGRRIARTDNAYLGLIADKETAVEGLDVPMLYLFLGADKGMSGGGLFDATGALLGVISASDMDGAVLCVPLPVIIEEISQFLSFFS